MRVDALQTFKNINSSTRENLEEIVAVFRKKYVKPQSMATAEHQFQKLVFNPANQNLVNFLDELQKLDKDAFGIVAHAIIEQFIYAKMPPDLKKSINQAHLEDGNFFSLHEMVTCCNFGVDLKFLSILNSLNFGPTPS